MTDVTRDDLDAMTLEAAPWGDGSSPFGFVNIICPELDLVIAQDVEGAIAHEIARRWNHLKEEIE